MNKRIKVFFYFIIIILIIQNCPITSFYNYGKSSDNSSLTKRTYFGAGFLLYGTDLNRTNSTFRSGFSS